MISIYNFFENEDIHLNRQLAKTINFFKSLPEEPKPKTKIIRTPAGPKEVIDTGIQNKTQNFAGYKPRQKFGNGFTNNTPGYIPKGVT